MHKKIDLILTDAPFVDILVYNTKILAINAIIKDEDRALAGENKRAYKESNIYMACREGRSRYDMFDYTRTILEATSIPPELISDCLKDKTKIPLSMREELNTYMTEWYLDNYVEYNNYYRMLNGLPDIGDDGIPVQEEWLPENVSYVEGTKLHELSAEVLTIMENSGTLEYIYNMYPNAEYIDHMGVYAIDIYTARKAEPFQILYTLSIEYIEIYNKFRSTYEKNRIYTMRRVYSEAYKFGSDYYNSFISVYILISTMIDMVSNIQEFIIHKEIFDSRCIRHVFESNGIPYYSEIPTKYQLKIIKNINKLAKYKASRRNMRDVCAIFGFDNIEIFKFYILRNRLVDKNGNYVFATKEIEDPNDPNNTITIEDKTSEYELKFVKVPIDSQPDEYVKAISDHINYDLITLSDPYWDGDMDHEEVRKKHLEADFGFKRSKYISIDTISDISEMSFDMPYFFNMLYDMVKLEENLLLYIPYINRSHYFRLTDTFCYLFALKDFYNNLTDYIYIDTYIRFDEETKEYNIETVEIKVDYDPDTKIYTIANIDEISNNNKYIAAFNFRPDTTELNRFFLENHVTKKDVGIEDFQMPRNNIVTYEMLLDIFESNKGVYKHIVSMLRKARNKREYDLYKKIYDMLMINVFQLDYFLLPDGTMPRTYTQYLKYKDNLLYLSLVDVAKISDLETRRKEIDDIVTNVLYSIDDYIDTDKYKYLFHDLPTVSADYIKKYIIKIIDIFKSYKIQLYDVNNIYNFTNRDSNTIRVIDSISDMIVKTRYKEKVEITDNAVVSLGTTFSEKIEIGEVVNITPYYETSQ